MRKWINKRVNYLKNKKHFFLKKIFYLFFKKIWSRDQRLKNIFHRKNCQLTPPIYSKIKLIDNFFYEKWKYFWKIKLIKHILI